VAVLGNLAFVTLNNGDLQAYHLSDGSLAWSVSGASAPLKEPTVGAGLLFAAGYPGNAFQQTIYAFDPTTGHTLWTFPFNTPWEAGSFIEGTGQPVIDGGVLYMAVPSGSAGTAYLFAIRLSDHTQLWNAPIQGTGLAVANGIVYVGGASPYVGTNNANLEAFDAATGGVKWTQPATSAGSLNALTVASGMVYASANNGALFAFDAASGQSKWSYKTGGTILVAPAVANGVVYVGSHDDCLYAVDATSGQLDWKAVTNGEISDTPVVGNGVVYIGSFNAAFFAFRT
jgi:outer membrane protein assembly factor BamB